MLLATAACGDAATDDELRVPELELPSAAALAADDDLRTARELIAAGAEKEAEPALRRVLAADPSSAEAHLLLGGVLFEADRYAAALPILERAVELAPGDLNALRMLAESHHVLENLGAAERCYRAWREQDDDVDAVYGLARILYLQGRHGDAVPLFRQAARRRQARADIRAELGLALQALGRLADAEAQYRDAIEREPENADAWFRLGDVISAQDPARRAEAIERMRRAVELRPGMLHAHLYLYRMETTAADEGDAEMRGAAEERWKRVLRAHATRQIAAAVPERRTQGGRTVRTLRRELEERPADHVLRRELARVLHARGRTTEAARHYATLREASAATSRDLRGEGASLLAEGQPGSAADVLRQAVAAAPGDGLARRVLAWALLASGAHGEALAVYDELGGAEADDRLARLGHGLALMRSGDLDGGLRGIAAAGWLE